MSTENKNNINILSDEELNQVSGGAALANGNPLTKPNAHWHITAQAKAAQSQVTAGAYFALSTVKSDE